MEPIGELVLAALSGGAGAVARAEVARLVQGGVHRLARRGRVSRELAIVADAVARSDDELAAEMKRLPPGEAIAAARQMDEALSYDGPDEDERKATGELRKHAEAVRGLLSQTQLIHGNHGQVVQASGQAQVHAPFHVARDYHASGESDSGSKS